LPESVDDRKSWIVAATVARMQRSEIQGQCQRAIRRRFFGSSYKVN
jgi:hypothetical protein